MSMSRALPSHRQRRASRAQRKPCKTPPPNAVSTPMPCFEKRASPKRRSANSRRPGLWDRSEGATVAYGLGGRCEDPFFVRNERAKVPRSARDDSFVVVDNVRRVEASMQKMVSSRAEHLRAGA